LRQVSIALFEQAKEFVFDDPPPPHHPEVLIISIIKETCPSGQIIFETGTIRVLSSGVAKGAMRSFCRSLSAQGPGAGCPDFVVQVQFLIILVFS
jgi:hypothetical protein